MSDTSPQVVVVNPPAQSSESEPGQNSEQQSEMMIQFGQMLERERQLTAQIATLEARLESESGSNQSLRAQIDSLSSQLERISIAIQEAEEELELETETSGDTVSVIPTPEPTPEPEPEPARPPSLLERICHRVNGL